MKALLAFYLMLGMSNLLPAQSENLALPPLFVAHRGASYLAPENTLASIKLAWELGADAAECDIMLTADHRVILMHDKNTKKLTGESFLVKESKWEELHSLVIRPRESNRPEYQQETIPLLSEVLSTLPEDRMLVIEIKTGSEILPYLQEVLAQHWTRGQISMIAFDFETICQAKSLYPEVPCYYLSMFKADFKKHLDEAVARGLDGMNLRHTIIDQEVAEQCRARGLDLWCWTVNDLKNARKMQELRVSALTTDRPAWLKEQLFTNN